MDYYEKKIMLPKVNKKDEVSGKVERWEAHKKGILHRAVTGVVYYKNQILCQHRKHPVFDGFLDLTCSTHPFYKGDKLIDTQEAIVLSLNREWGIKESGLSKKPVLKGKVYYRSKDVKGYIEHEVCHLYSAKIKYLPDVKFDYSYGFSLLSVEQLKSLSPLKNYLAPWVKKFLAKKVL